MSLKERLNILIKDAGTTVSINEIERLCHEWGYKISNYERRLRPSESPNVERVFKNNAIIGYRWKQSETVRDFLRDYPSKIGESMPVTINALF